MSERTPLGLTLNGLIDDGLLTKVKKDDRTNEYATTDETRQLLKARTKQCARGCRYHDRPG